MFLAYFLHMLCISAASLFFLCFFFFFLFRRVPSFSIILLWLWSASSDPVFLKVTVYWFFFQHHFFGLQLLSSVPAKLIIGMICCTLEFVVNCLLQINKSDVRSLFFFQCLLCLFTFYPLFLLYCTCHFKKKNESCSLQFLSLFCDSMDCITSLKLQVCVVLYWFCIVLWYHIGTLKEVWVYFMFKMKVKP